MKSWGVIGRSSLLKSCNNFNLNASMATCQAAPFIGTYETNTIGYYVDVARALVRKARLLVAGSATAADISGQLQYDQKLPCLSWSRYAGCRYRPRDASLRDGACGSSAR